MCIRDRARRRLWIRLDFPALLAPKTRVIGFNGTRCGGFGPKALKFAMENEVSTAVRGR